MAELETKTIHSVAKAIRLLDLLAERTKPATLTELYQATGWPKSTIHGLLSTMREAGLIEQTPNGRYWLGIRLFEYAARCPMPGTSARLPARICRKSARSWGNRSSCQSLTGRRL